MKVSGDLRKMKSSLDKDRAIYHLMIDGKEPIPLNELLGSRISLRFTGVIHCVNCGRSIKKTYGDGYCYNCFSTVPQTAPCVIRPELCEAHLGKGRDVEWEKANHHQPHIVYLAETAGVKVGVTRKKQIPTRWIDQGANRAIKFAETPNRRLAGEMEVYLKQFLSDKTDWRKLLTGEDVQESSLLSWKEQLGEFLNDELKQYFLDDNEVQQIHYPVKAYPSTAKSVTLDKEPKIKEAIVGIRGQYWIVDDGLALNIRRHSGYEVEIEF